MRNIRLTMTITQKLYQLLCGPKLLHFVLPALMVYLVIGTVAQKYVGLYEASRLYFSAPFIWVLYVFPLPGMPVLVALVFFNLAFKLAFKSPWHWRNAGNIITHIGAMLLLLGGLFTAIFSSEGYIAIPEGSSESRISDYHKREFAVMDDRGELVGVFDHKTLRAGQVLPALPFEVKILERCRNCKITARADGGEDHQGMAAHMQLSDDTLKNNDEENMAGLTFRVDGVDIFVALEDVSEIPSAEIDGKTYRFVLRRAERVLPFSITLVDFEKQVYPGTDTAREYQSHVLITDGDLQWESVISMNAPLRYKGYTFFQSSFFETPSGEVSVLAAVWNVGRAFPYISGLLMCIGLILHLFLRRRVAALVLLCLVVPQGVYAQGFDTRYFAQLPVLDAGRVKPIESFARAQKKILSGSEKDAMAWLLLSLFDPARAEHIAVIKITNPDVLSVLSLERRESKLYSYTEVFEALDRKQDLILGIVKADQDQWSLQHRALISLQEKTVSYQKLMGSLAGFLPLDVSFEDGRKRSYFDLMGEKDELLSRAQALAQQGQGFETFSADDAHIVELSYLLSTLEENGRRSVPFKVIPVEGVMLAPWQVLLEGKSSDYLSYWEGLARAYHAGDASMWNDSLRALYTLYVQEDDRLYDLGRVQVEYYYTLLHPFVVSFVFCLVALCVLGVQAYTRKGLLRAAFWILMLSAGMQIAGIAARIYILERPPVSTLYETVLFVCALVMMYCTLRRGLFWLGMAAGLGTVLHILGFAHEGDGDSLLVLPAVLNTNFWLATHVLSITAGYAFCAIASALAHYLLLRGEHGGVVYGHMLSTALIALFFATIGTVLGGIWADQSWGRFWGWDPKENGALLIVLWLIWVLHGRISGMMRPQGVLYAMSFLCVILALSWFGVNLLSVGLHSYGFTDGLGLYLSGFIALECLFLLFIFLREHRCKKLSSFL